MIVNMQKFLIYGAKDHLDRFFSLAQRAGFLEFIGIWHKTALELPQHIKYILSAIKILRTWVGAEHGIELAVLSNPAILAERVVQLNGALTRHLEEQRMLHLEIARVAPFGDFAKSDVFALERDGRRIFQFFCMKSDLANDMSLPPELIWVGTDYDLDYYVAINEERAQYPKMMEILIPHPLGELREHLQDVQIRIAGLEAELKCMAVNLPFLQEGLIDCLNDHHLQAAKHDASYPLGEAVFAIEAWVPLTRLKGLQGLLSGLSVYSEEIAIEPHDHIPTCMENTGVGRIGEDLVHIYDTPATTDQDPSTWVLVFFSIFFAMIISDAGYGLLYLALGLFLKGKFPRAGGVAKRCIKLTVILASMTIFWGVLSGNYFGLEIGPNNLFQKASLVHYLGKKRAGYELKIKGEVYQKYEKRFPAVATAANGQDFLEKAVEISKGKERFAAMDDFSDNLMMEMSLVIGIIHLCISFTRWIRRHWAGIGWIAFMIGGYLFFPASVFKATTVVNFMGWVSPETAYVAGEALLYGGIGFAMIATMIQHGIGKGLFEVFHVTKILGDCLSYLRLYALGLAGILMATTFNAMGRDFGLVAGTIIIVLGHLANLGIGVMAGTIHGLRLNFLEWYHYCFDGGGRFFNPLHLKRPKL